MSQTNLRIALWGIVLSPRARTRVLDKLEKLAGDPILHNVAIMKVRLTILTNDAKLRRRLLRPLLSDGYKDTTPRYTTIGKGSGAKVVTWKLSVISAI